MTFMGMTYTKMTLGALQAVAANNKKKKEKEEEEEEDDDGDGDRGHHQSNGDGAAAATAAVVQTNDDNISREDTRRSWPAPVPSPPRAGVTLLGAASCLPLVFGFYSSMVLVRDYQQTPGDAIAGAAVGVVASLACW